MIRAVRTYDEALKVWGARKLGLADDANVTVEFDLGSWDEGNSCETCGWSAESEFTAIISTKRRKVIVELDHDFSGLLKEILDVAGEAR
jgi:hypothetical protein